MYYIDQQGAAWGMGTSHQSRRRPTGQKAVSGRHPQDSNDPQLRGHRRRFRVGSGYLCAAAGPGKRVAAVITTDPVIFLDHPVDWKAYDGGMRPEASLGASP